MSDERLIRQLDLIDQEKVDIPIHIIGVGGIGSWTVLLLAKSGFNNIYIYDNDTVENHNVASQFFKESQLGMAKTEAVVANVKEQTGIDLKPLPISEEANIKEGLVIIAVDSIEERAKLGAMFRDKDVYIIDGRMGGLDMEIYRSHASRYEATIPPSEAIERESCTGRSICFNCAVIGGFISSFVRKFINNNLTEGYLTMNLNNHTVGRG